MAYSDFNEDYRNRTSGLSAWLQSLQDPAALQNRIAKNAGFDTSEVNAGATESSPVDFGGLNPNDKAISLAQEAFQPGSADIQQSKSAAPEQPFRDSTFGQILGGMMPNTVGRVFDSQRGKALSDYAQNMPTDPLEAIQGMMKIDPHNAQAFIPELMAASAKEPELKRQKDLQAYLKSLSDQGGLTPPSAAPATSALQAFDKYPAQTQAESAGNPNAVSPAGAQGLKQIMPGTGVDPGYGVKPLQNNSPEENLRFGNDYYDAMLKLFNGNVNDALAGYNWGPEATKKWVLNGSDPSQMPQETKDYIAKLAPVMTAKSANQSALASYANDGLLHPGHQPGENYLDSSYDTFENSGHQDAASTKSNAEVLGVPSFLSQQYSQPSNPAMAPMAVFKDPVQAAPPAQQAPAAPASALSQFNQHLTPEEGMALKMAAIDPKYADNALAAFGKRFQSTPYTAAAKAQADLQHGMITQQQYDEMEKAGLFKQGDSNLPSSIQEANAYEAAKKLGTPEGNQRAADIAMFAKTSGVADPAVLAQAVDAVGQNDVNSATLFSRGSLADKAAIISAVRAKYPNWNQRQFDAIADFNNGTHGDQVKFTSNVTEHLELSRELFKALENGNTPLFNKVAQAWAQQTGSEVPTDFQSAVNIVGQEMVKSIVPSGGGVSDRDEAQKAFDLAKSPAQGEGALNTIEKMMRTQIRGNERQFMNSTGGNKKDFMKLISPQAAAVLYPEENAQAQGAGASPAPDLSALQAAAAAELAKRKGG